MTNSPALPEAGWYHCDGDPDDTVRRWNGHTWIGFPMQADQVDPEYRAPSTTAAPLRFGLTAGQQALGIASMAVLSVLAVLFAATAYHIWSGLDTPRIFTRFDPVRNVGDFFSYVPGTAKYLLAITVGMVIAAVLFIAWLREIAVVARISRLGAASRKRADRSILLMVLQFLVFGIFAVIWWLLRAAMAGIATASGGSRGMLGIMTDTAMAASIDPQTGISRISPVKTMLWWVLWWGPAIVSAVSIGWLYWRGTDAQGLHNLVQLHAILFALEAVSLLLIIATIAQINRYLKR